MIEPSSGTPPDGDYPAKFSFDAPDKVANWRPLVSWLLAIPHFAILYGLRVLGQVIAVISWFITFLGRGRGQMAITERWVFARRALEQSREQSAQKSIG